jgi:uncharacterized membrane protein
MPFYYAKKERKGNSMNKIDWIRKLTSRKLWVAVVGLVTSMLLIFGMAESDASQIAGIIMQAATVLGYLLAEGLTDAAGTKSVDTTKEE